MPLGGCYTRLDKGTHYEQCDRPAPHRRTLMGALWYVCAKHGLSADGDRILVTLDRSGAGVGNPRSEVIYD